MNIEAIRKRWQKYYETATPEQVLAEFEAMGVEFEDLTEPAVEQLVMSDTDSESAIYFYDIHQWQEMVSVNPGKVINALMNLNYIWADDLKPVNAENILSENYQYAMAA